MKKSYVKPSLLMLVCCLLFQRCELFVKLDETMVMDCEKLSYETDGNRKKLYQCPCVTSIYAYPSTSSDRPIIRIQNIHGGWLHPPQGSVFMKPVNQNEELKLLEAFVELNDGDRIILDPSKDFWDVDPEGWKGGSNKLTVFMRNSLNFTFTDTWYLHYPFTPKVWVNQCINGFIGIQGDRHPVGLEVNQNPIISQGKFANTTIKMTRNMNDSSIFTISEFFSFSYFTIPFGRVYPEDVFKSYSYDDNPTSENIALDFLLQDNVPIGSNFALEIWGQNNFTSSGEKWSISCNAHLAIQVRPDGE
jgi:hypothetical protein